MLEAAERILAEEAARFYTSVFPDSRITEISPNFAPNVSSAMHVYPTSGAVQRVAGIGGREQHGRAQVGPAAVGRVGDIGPERGADDEERRENAAGADVTLPPEDLERVAELWRSGVLS